MANVTAKMVKELREKSGAGMRPLCGCDEESYSAYGH